MVFDFFDFFDKDDNISSGSLGAKIKRIRELRGLTQKQLGIRCGYSPSTADVRISQYEKNKKIPRKQAMKDIAQALQVDENVFYDADFSSYYALYHILFDLEDFHGLHPVKIDGKFYLEFSGYSISGERINIPFQSDFFELWYNKRKQYEITESDSKEEIKKKINEYSLWKYEYPLNEVVEQTEQRTKQAKYEDLQVKLDEAYAELMEESETNRVQNAINSFLIELRNSENKNEVYESELLLCVKELMENGISVVYLTNTKYSSKSELNEFQLFSISTESVLNDESNFFLFARFMYLIEVINNNGIYIRQTISSENKELYVTFTYEKDQLDFFLNIVRYFDDMIKLVGKKESYTEEEYEKLSREFIDKISGDNDVLLKAEQ